MGVLIVVEILHLWESLPKFVCQEGSSGINITLLDFLFGFAPALMPKNRQVRTQENAFAALFP